VPEAEALARWSAGDPAGAEPCFADAAARWQGVITRNVWRSQLGQAECRRQAGDVDGAVELFQGVVDESRARGLVVLVRRAEAGLRRCGVEPGPRRRPGLTVREALVLERVAAGATSVDIAAELHVTARTIDKTVARAMRKLGASTRHQAARLAAGGQGRPPAPPTLPAADLPADSLALLRRIAAGETISAAAHAVGLSRRTATRRLGELRAALGVTTTAGILDALSDPGRAPRS
jgi:DNA-binding NarL/FixJ family response regulator